MNCGKQCPLPVRKEVGNGCPVYVEGNTVITLSLHPQSDLNELKVTAAFDVPLVH